LVTERRRTEAQLRMQQESLSRLARLGSMGELAAAVAHEINQPLTAAGTYARLVDHAIGSGRADLAAVAEPSKKTVAQIERAADVVRHLRALVRLDRSDRAPCSLDRIVRETIELCQHDLDRAHVSVRAYIPADFPSVMVDLLQIEQVLINLLRNAVDAISGSSNSGGAVFISAKRADIDFAEVHVADSGPGFPPQFSENAFLPLSSSKDEGLGIGLALCRSIVEAHGGKLWLDDGRSGGVVRFTLPLAKASGS
jgi:C4-dicarboxylate-specific signal transduction histidine kinase